MPAASSQSTERTPLECRLTALGCVARFRGKVEWVLEDRFGIVEPDGDDRTYRRQVVGAQGPLQLLRRRVERGIWPRIWTLFATSVTLLRTP